MQVIDGSSNLDNNANEDITSGASAAESSLGGETGMGALLGPDIMARADSIGGD